LGTLFRRTPVLAQSRRKSALYSTNERSQK
jgi:hypothetical protein